MGPFDRFNDRAKRVLALAQDEAIRFNHNYIGVEHLVLGLIREGEGVAARVLDALGADIQKARSSVEFIIGRGDASTSPSEITLSPRTKKVIELAIDEARKLGHSHVGTEHLLLAIVREGQSVGTGVLEAIGVAIDSVRERVLAVLGQVPTATAAPAEGIARMARVQMRPHERLGGDAQLALVRAYWEAGRANAEEVEPHHLLLGLIASEQAWIRRILRDLAIDPTGLATLIDAAAPRRDGLRPAGIRESRSLMEAFGRAASIAAERNFATMRSEHLLLAVAAGDDIAANVLATAGATPQKIREISDRMSG
ncbi:MAG TPA: Clp protease N-terminal domain-containing protein [Candidatus Limnocylindria bacterium]|jgi:ATP-dependent Clp protease ATP-binding subunit ClpA